MDLKVGMYVRTKIGIIGKILSIDKDSEKNDVISLFNGNFHIIHERNRNQLGIIKASHNIIDLIEVGDYVNGKKVAFKNEYEDDYYIQGETSNGFIIEYEYQEEIKSIVTKEQFASMEYKVGE